MNSQGHLLHGFWQKSAGFQYDSFAMPPERDSGCVTPPTTWSYFSELYVSFKTGIFWY